MNTEIDPRIEQEIDKLYNHEIKAKRVKKEILNLNDLHLENIVIEHVRFSSIGIRIPVMYEISCRSPSKRKENIGTSKSG